MAEQIKDAETAAKETRRGRYRLEDLIANSDPEAFVRTPEDEEWLNSPAVGRELI